MREGVIKNALALVGGEFTRTDIEVRNGLISSFGASGYTGGETIDAAGCYALPGFIDTHVHGGAGLDFSSPDADLDKLLRWERSQGVTAVVATTRCMAFGDCERAVANIKKYVGKATDGAAKVAGAHIEGPFVSPFHRGAMTPEYVVPVDFGFLERLLATDCVRIISLAPELEGACEAAEMITSRGALASMAHSGATYEQSRVACEHGFSRATHLFNAMSPLNHREPGVAGYALADENVMCELICDYVHVSPAVVATVIKAKGAKGVCMVSDSCVMSGTGDGEFVTEGRRRTIKNGVCRLDDGTIAGSCVSLYAGVKNLFGSGVPLEDISVMASKNPAVAAGLNAGVLEVGYDADIILLDRGLNLVY